MKLFIVCVLLFVAVALAADHHGLLPTPVPTPAPTHAPTPAPTPVSSNSRLETLFHLSKFNLDGVVGFQTPQPPPTKTPLVFTFPGKK